MDAKGKGKAEDVKESRGDCATKMKSWKMTKRGWSRKEKRTPRMDRESETTREIRMPNWGYFQMSRR